MTSSPLTHGTAISSMCGTASIPIYTANITAAPGMNITYSTGGTLTWLPQPTPEAVDTMIEQLVTIVKPGEKIVVCVDDNFTGEQAYEVQQSLHDSNLPGIVIRGARAGTGFNAGFVPPTEEDRRVDILARLGELWSKCPTLRLTDLLSWYNGESMPDEEFATSAEVYFTKVTNGIHRKS